MSRGILHPTHDRVRSLGELFDTNRLAGIGVDLDSPALVDAIATLSWRQAAERIGRLGSALASIGVRRRDRVGVRMLKSVDSFVAVHAVHRAGAVVVPLDPMATAEAGRRITADADLTALITDHRTPRHAAFVDAVGPMPTIDLTSVETPVASTTRRRRHSTASRPTLTRVDLASHRVIAPVATAADDDAYLIYTSGSTGEPKGIVHTHASAIAYASAAAAEYELSPADRLANFAPLHFDQSTFELYAAPLAGSSTAILSEAVLRLPPDTASRLADWETTVWYTVPSLLSQLVRRGGLAAHDFGALRLVLLGGEPFAPTRVRELMDALPDVTMSNVYGPAEVNQCTRHDLVHRPAADRPIPIGRAWSNAETAVVATHDPTSDPAAPNVEGALLTTDSQTDVGELFVRSPTAMRGYWRRPDLTAEVLVDAPTAFGRVIDRADGRSEADRLPSDGLGWLRTGDLVQVGPDGLLHLVGRRDDQV